MTLRSGLSALMALAATATLTACGSPAPKACDVLTADIAKKYLGADAVLRRNMQPNPAETQCQYGGSGGVITVMTGPWAMIYNKTDDDRAVSGIGDEAWSSFSGLDVRKGGKGISIDVMVESGEFWGQAATDEETKTVNAEKKVAPELVAKL